MVCERGGNARTDKGRAVETAGGVGMILFNPTTNPVNADCQPVPTVHVDVADGTAIKAYANTANATASRRRPCGRRRRLRSWPRSPAAARPSRCRVTCSSRTPPRPVST